MQPGLSFKLRAALLGLTFIQSGMIVGLGAGSTAILAVRGLGEKLAQGELRDIRGNTLFTPDRSRSKTCGHSP